MLKLIVSIDGIDGSGKETTSKLVHEMLEERGYRVKVISPPFYDEPSGAAIKDVLTCGGVAFPMRRMVSSLYEVDRNIYMAKHAKELANYDILLYNRSWLSNLFYQTSMEPSGIMDIHGIPTDESQRINQAISHITQGFFAEIEPWTIGDRNDGEFNYMRKIPCLNIVLHTPMDVPSVGNAIMEGIIKRGAPDVNEQINFLKAIWENIDFLHDNLLGVNNLDTGIDIPSYLKNNFKFYITSCMQAEYAFSRNEYIRNREWPKYYQEIFNFYQFLYVNVFNNSFYDGAVIRRKPDEIAQDAYDVIERKLHRILKPWDSIYSDNPLN